MCCNSGPRRTPLTVVLATAAYKAYKDHKEKRRLTTEQGILATQDGAASYANSRIPEQSLTDAMRGLKLEQSGIAPPHYDDVIQVHRNALPEEPSWKVRARQAPAYEKEEDRDDLSDADSLLADDFLAGGPYAGGRREMQTAVVSKSERRSMRREEKRREWEAWRAEKIARRAERRAARGCGSCC